MTTGRRNRQDGTSPARQTGEGEFRVGHYAARWIMQECFGGAEFRIELLWHDPESGVINDIATFRRDVVDACAALQLALLDESLATTRDWLVANARWAPPGSLARALDRVVGYLWSEEERDYWSRSADDRAGHIYESLLLLARFASGPGKARRELA